MTPVSSPPKHVKLLGSAATIAAALLLAGCGGSNDPKFDERGHALSLRQGWDVAAAFEAINDLDGLPAYVSAYGSTFCMVWKRSDAEVGLRVGDGGSGTADYSLIRQGGAGGWEVAPRPWGSLGEADPTGSVWCAVDPDGFVYGERAPETYPAEVRIRIKSKLDAAVAAVNSGGASTKPS